MYISEKIENYLNEHIPLRFLETCEAKRVAAEIKGEALSTVELKEDINSFISNFNALTAIRNERHDYDFMDTLSEAYGELAREDERLGWDYVEAIRAHGDRIYSTVYKYLDTLTARLKTIFAPEFNDEDSQKLNGGTFCEKWFHEYSSHFEANHVRDARNYESMCKYVTLEIPGEPVQSITYKITPLRHTIDLYVGDQRPKEELQAILLYNFEADLKDWMEKNTLGEEDEYLKQEIKVYTLQMEKLGIVDKVHTEEEKLNRSIEYSQAKFLHKIAEERLSNLNLDASTDSNQHINEPVQSLIYNLVALHFQKFEKNFNTKADFTKAIGAITSFFNNDTLQIKEPIFVKGRITKKLAFTMGEIWRSQRNIPITNDYLLHYKKVFSIFQDQDITSEELFKKKLYKYSH